MNEIIQQVVGNVKLTGRMWPNGEFSFGREATTGKAPVSAGEDSWLASGHPGLEEMMDEREGRTDPSTIRLGLSNAPNSHRGGEIPEIESRKTRGSNGLTRYGAKVVRNAVYLIERDAPQYCVSFGTLTLPDMPPHVRGQVLRLWPRLLRVFFQKLSRTLKKRYLPGEVAYVVELHPKRGESTGEIWPHLHFVFQGKKHRYGKDWAIKPAELGKMWRDVVEESIPNTSAYWRDSHWNVQGVAKSAEAYLSKYLSKGQSKTLMLNDQYAAENPIRSWFGCVGGLKKRLKRSVRSLDNASCHAIMKESKTEDKNKYFHYYHDVTINFRGLDYWAGGVGKMTHWHRDEWAEYLEGVRGA